MYGSLSVNLGIKPDLSVAFVLAPQFTLMAFAGFIDALRHAADESDRSRQIFCQWSIVSDTEEPIRSSCGVEVSHFECLPDPQRFNYIVVVGGLVPQCLDISAKTLDFVRQAAGKGIPIIGLCTGGMILAKANLMKGRRCAIHVRHRQDLIKLFPDVIPVTEDVYVEDDGLFTCPGGVASIDLAVEIITRHCGRARAVKGLYAMLLQGNDPPRGVMWRLHKDTTYYYDQRVRQAICLMEESIGSPYPIKDLAGRLGITVRQLNRLFVEQSGQTPAAMWREIRLTHARWLLVNSSRSVTRIAYECGFSDCAHFTRWFRRTYSEAPFEFRRQRRKAVLTHQQIPSNLKAPYESPDL